LVGLMVIVSLIDKKGQQRVHGIEVEASMFRTSQSFAIGALIVLGVITGLYLIFW